MVGFTKLVTGIYFGLITVYDVMHAVVLRVNLLFYAYCCNLLWMQMIHSKISTV